MEKTVNVFTENNIQIGTISEAEYRGIIGRGRKNIKLHICQLLMNLKTSMNIFLLGLKFSLVMLLSLLAAAYLAGDKEIVSAVLSAKSLLINGHNDADVGVVLNFFSYILDYIVKCVGGFFYVSLLMFGMLTYGEIKRLFVFNKQKKAVRDDDFLYHRSFYLDYVGLEIKTLLQEPYNGPVWVAYEN